MSTARIDKSRYLMVIYLISFSIFAPSLFTFFTNDDFFLLKISQATTFGQVLNFFNFTSGPERLGMYRPLTTQLFYYLGIKVFDSNPIWLHAISFIVFFGVVLLVYMLAKAFTKNEFVAILSAFLYAVSATHFAHLYYLATFQELGVALFFLLAYFSFYKHLKKEDTKSYLLSILFFVLALLSKETSVVFPFALILLYILTMLRGEIKLKLSKFIKKVIPFFLILVPYLYFHFFVYGLAEGESYIWNFSPVKALNSLFWYLLWSFNLPEMLVDFVGPGLNINPNLFKFWANEMIPIFVLFGLLITMIVYFVLRSLRRYSKGELYLVLFSGAWFILTLIPVLFLPLHKFTYYLTLPLFGVVLTIAYLIKKAKVKKILVLIFLSIYLVNSITTLSLTRETHWITRGADVAQRVLSYLEGNKEKLSGKTVVFYDTEDDEDLPWSPTQTLKVVLSDKNFFEVFYKEEIQVNYGERQVDSEYLMLKSRDFLGY